MNYINLYREITEYITISPLEQRRTFPENTRKDSELGEISKPVEISFIKSIVFCLSNIVKLQDPRRLKSRKKVMNYE